MEKDACEQYQAARRIPGENRHYARHGRGYDQGDANAVQGPEHQVRLGADPDY